jgi:thioredoxin 1
MLNLNDSNFESWVSSGHLAVVDLWAPWCGPCRALIPIIEQVANELGHGVAIAKLNVDECPAIAEKLNVTSIPTLIFFKNGAEIKRSVGSQTKADILATINSL